MIQSVRDSLALRLQFVLLLVAFTVRMLFDAGAARAESDEISALLEAILFPQVVEVLATEGQGMAEDLAESGYGVPQEAWATMLAQLYDPDVMESAFHEELSAALAGADLAPLLTFYRSDLGEEIARLELETRKAMQGDEAQEAAGAAWAALDPTSERAKMIEAYVQSNDLIDMNVVGAMNSDIAYYQGLWRDGAPEGMGMSNEELLDQIWASEPEVRADVAEWVYGFSTLAYKDLNDAEFADYIAFGKSEAGRRFNAALFSAFDGMYKHLSRGLGVGTAQLVQVYEGERL